MNQNLLAYWDTVADRLFKIRNSENIQGVAQQLPLFDPPLDPGMLVQAAAAGLDIGSIVSGLNQPPSPVRSLFLIGKSLEIAAEVRSLGASLLAALEKGDAEQLAMLRQTHEVQLQQMVQNVRYLQWQHAQETTNGLLKTRAITLERYNYYLRLLNLIPDPSTVPDTFAPDRRELTEANFADTYSALVGEYDLAVATLAYNPLQLAQGSSPSTQSGAAGQGQLYLNKNEDDELNNHLPTARRRAASRRTSPTPSPRRSYPIPSAEVHLAFWGIGAHSKILAGTSLAGVAKVAADILQVIAAWEQDQAGIARAHRGTPAARRRVDAPGEPGRARAGADRPADHRVADRRAGRQARLRDGQDPGAAGAGQSRASCRTSSPTPPCTPGCKATCPPCTTSTTGSPATPPARRSRP